MKLRIWTKNSHVPLKKKKKARRRWEFPSYALMWQQCFCRSYLGALQFPLHPLLSPGAAQNQQQQKAQCLLQWVPMGRGPSASTRPLPEKGPSTLATHNSSQRGRQSSPLPDCQVAQRPSWSDHYLREQCQMTSPSAAQGRAPREGPRRARSISRQQGHCMQEV